jgi:hypothetical protein
MNDDLELARTTGAAANTEAERRTSFRDKIERLFAEYTASLRHILGSRELTEQRYHEATDSRLRRRKSPKDGGIEGSGRTAAKR